MDKINFTKSNVLCLRDPFSSFHQTTVSAVIGHLTLSSRGFLDPLFLYSLVRFSCVGVDGVR